MYLSADSNVALLKVNCHLYVEYYLTQKVVFSLLTYDSIKKNIKEKKEVLEVLIHLN